MLSVARRNQVVKHIQSQRGPLHVYQSLRWNIPSPSDFIPEADKEVFFKYAIATGQITRSTLVSLGLATYEQLNGAPNPIPTAFQSFFARAQTIQDEDEVAQLVSDVKEFVQSCGK